MACRPCAGRGVRHSRRPTTLSFTRSSSLDKRKQSSTTDYTDGHGLEAARSLAEKNKSRPSPSGCPTTPVRVGMKMSELYAHTAPGDCSNWEPLHGEPVRGSLRAHRPAYEHFRLSAIASLISSALRKLFIFARTLLVASFASRIRLRAASTPLLSGPVAPMPLARSATICWSSVCPFLRARSFSAAWISSGIVMVAMRERMTFSIRPLNLLFAHRTSKISGMGTAFVTK